MTDQTEEHIENAERAVEWLRNEPWIYENRRVAELPEDYKTEEPY